MSTTKEKILDAALTLFNREGCQSITVRQLAAEVGISHGNLCYHYPTVDDVIQKLYFRFMDSVDTKFETMKEKNISLEFLFEVGRATFELGYQYKFLFLDFVGILRRQPKIREHYLEMKRRRKDEFTQIFKHLHDEGIIHSEIYPGQYEHIAEVTTIVGDFWNVRAEMLFEGDEQEKIAYYVSVCYAPILSMYTEKGMAKAMDLMEKIKNQAVA
jgi:AcrR family transcriptional regulator